MQKYMKLHMLGLALASCLMNEATEGGEGAAPATTAPADDKATKAAAKAAEKQAEKERKAKEKADAKAKKEQEAAAKKAERDKDRQVQHGISRPLSGATKQVWDLADAISAEARRPAERKEVTERGLAAGLQQGTIHTQYGRWRKFHGLSSVREADKSNTASTEAAQA